MSRRKHYKDEGNPHKDTAPIVPEALDPSIIDARKVDFETELSRVKFKPRRFGDEDFLHGQVQPRPPDGSITQTEYSAYGKECNEELTSEEKALFLQVLCEHGIVSYAAKSIGRTRMTMYNHRKKDEEFRRLWDLALELGVEALIDESKRRAFAGSDLLMIFMLKHLKRDTFGEQTQRGGGAIPTDALGNPKRIILEWGDDNDRQVIEGGKNASTEATQDLEGVDVDVKVIESSIGNDGDGAGE